MLAGQLSTLVQLWRDATSDLHDGFEHLIVAVACEKHFAGVKLIERAPDGPHVHTVVVRHAEDDFRSSVETTHQVRRNSGVGSRGI